MLPGELAEQDLLAIRIVEADSWRITAIVDASSAIEMVSLKRKTAASGQQPIASKKKAKG